MTLESNTQAESAEGTTPYADLVSSAGQKLAELFPDQMKEIESLDGLTLAENLVGEVLIMNELHGASFHRLSTERQLELLAGRDFEALFVRAADEGLKEFYRKKLESRKPK